MLGRSVEQFYQYFIWVCVAFLSLIQVQCGISYPDDVFKDVRKGFENYYMITNTYYTVSGGSEPVLANSVSTNRILFMINQRDDVYYNKGFNFTTREYDYRLFLQLTNVNTNFYFFNDTAFSSNVNMFYYDLRRGSMIDFTNGYLWISNNGSYWDVNMNVQSQDQHFNHQKIYPKARYLAESKEFILE